MSPETMRTEPRPREVTPRKTTNIVTLILGASLLVSLAAKAHAEHHPLAGLRTAIELLDKRFLRCLTPGFQRVQDGTIHHPEREGLPPHHDCIDGLARAAQSTSTSTSSVRTTYSVLL